MPAQPVREAEAGSWNPRGDRTERPRRAKAGTPGCTASLHFHPMLRDLECLVNPAFHTPPDSP